MAEPGNEITFATNQQVHMLIDGELVASADILKAGTFVDLDPVSSDAQRVLLDGAIENQRYEYLWYKSGHIVTSAAVELATAAGSVGLGFEAAISNSNLAKVAYAAGATVLGLLSMFSGNRVIRAIRNDFPDIQKPAQALKQLRAMRSQTNILIPTAVEVIETPEEDY